MIIYSIRQVGYCATLLATSVVLSACGSGNHLASSEDSSLSSSTDSSSLAATEIPHVVESWNQYASSGPSSEGECESYIFGRWGVMATCTPAYLNGQSRPPTYSASFQGPNTTELHFKNRIIEQSITGSDKTQCTRFATDYALNFGKSATCVLGGGCAGDPHVNPSTYGACVVDPYPTGQSAYR